MQLIIKIVVNAVAIWVATAIVPGVVVSDGNADLGRKIVTLLVVGALFGVVNALIKPTVKLFALPFYILTLGLFAFIVNAARGGIVDEAAIVAAIQEGHVGGAALDVFVNEPLEAGSPLVSSDKIILTPHLGASTGEAQERVALEIAEQVADYLINGTVKNAVNVPSLPGEAAKRLAPYQSLARKLGKLLGQLEPIEVKELRVTCTGEAGEFGARIHDCFSSSMPNSRRIACVCSPTAGTASMR
jgi:uncharacterized membrane protein YvlD (DUF360 family)